MSVLLFTVVEEEKRAFTMKHSTGSTQGIDNDRKPLNRIKFDCKSNKNWDFDNGKQQVEIGG